jgi:hypothetical protein
MMLAFLPRRVKVVRRKIWTPTVGYGALEANFPAKFTADFVTWVSVHEH